MFPIGLNLQRLDNYIDGVSGADPVTLSYRPETRAIVIEHTNVEVEMAGIDPDAIRDEPEVPDLDHSVEFTADAGVLRDAVENAELVSDHVVARSSCRRSRTCREWSRRHRLDRETVLGPTKPEANFESDATSMYSLEYLVGGSKKGTKYKGLIKPLSADTELRVEFSEESPVKMHYDFADGFGHVTVMLAPRIQAR